MAQARSVMTLPKITLGEVAAVGFFLSHVVYTVLFIPLIAFKLLGLSTDQLFYLMVVFGVADVVAWFFLFRKVLNVVYARKIFSAMQ